MDKQLQALQHNLEAVVQRAMESCEASGHAAADHFRDATKMIGLDSGAIAMGKIGSATP
jgi:hypothetical protein